MAVIFALELAHLLPENFLALPSRLHDQDLIGNRADALLGDEHAWPQLTIARAEWIPEIEFLSYEGHMAPIALRALARRRYEMRMERKAARTERYHRRMERCARLPNR